MPYLVLVTMLARILNRTRHCNQHLVISTRCSFTILSFYILVLTIDASLPISESPEWNFAVCPLPFTVDVMTTNPESVETLVVLEKP